MGERRMGEKRGKGERKVGRREGMERGERWGKGGERNRYEKGRDGKNEGKKRRFPQVSYNEGPKFLFGFWQNVQTYCGKYYKRPLPLPRFVSIADNARVFVSRFLISIKFSLSLFIIYIHIIL